MDLYEYQAKELLRNYGLIVPPCYVAKSAEEIDAIIENHEFETCVIKAQVLTGGRGKAGGVRLCHTKEEMKSQAYSMLGMKLVTKQTGPQGVIVREILFTPAVSIQKECYISIVLDRKNGAFALIASKEGGVEIEEVAAKAPDKILVIPFESKARVRSFHVQRILRFLGLENKASSVIYSLLDAFFALDCTLLEINPLATTTDGQLVLLDAKMSIDSNASFRQKWCAKYDDTAHLSQAELLAKQHDLSYITLDGNIGCMVNGAGLAMATMDLIRHWGGEPANFLDVGGGASLEKVTAGFHMLLSEPKVKAVLVNIFGGIMNCETIALALKQAVADTGLKIPLVVRMEGTNVDSAREILKQALPQAHAAASLDEAAELVVRYGNSSQ